MLKKLIVAAALALVGFSLPVLAVVGTPPISGPALQDGTWLNGLAAGQNNNYVYGLTAAGTNQATCAPLPSGYYIVEADTVASGTGFCLPISIPGTDLLFYNNGANTVTIYPNATNNPATGSQDTINNTTSVTVASHVSQAFSTGKAGVWFSK